MNKQSSEGKCYRVKLTIQLGYFRKRTYCYNQHENTFNRKALPGACYITTGYTLFTKHLISNKYFGNVEFRDVSALTMYRSILRLHYAPWISDSCIESPTSWNDYRTCNSRIKWRCNPCSCMLYSVIHGYYVGDRYSYPCSRA